MRILSYNIHKGIGGRDRRYRFGRVLAVIEAANPDIVCLQEVDRNVRRSRYHDQPQLLVDYFGDRQPLYQMNVRLKEGGYGNLVLSRWPVRSHHHISLRHEERKPRGAQLAVIETPEGPLHVVHWHLGLAERERRWQVLHLLSHSLYREAERLPTLLIGDSNDWRNRLQSAVLGPRGFHQVTAPISRFRTFPSYLAMGSLDKAFIRGAISVRHARVVRTRLARIASDHLPLVIDFHISGPRAGWPENDSPRL
ncbi:MAG TPA: endonuclease/exonuclease/phosphatase family protein [Planctomycetaceae bacterium]|nr:endonuclease/exonuclease/phosphatase family protein [Planctomycetaceae bacterium]